MKQPFVNATMNDRRKGKEANCHTTQTHPLRPRPLDASDAPPLRMGLPVKVMHAPPKKEEPVSELETMKKELLKAMREADKKPRTLPKNKLIGMANATAKEEPVRDYNDILEMLLAKK